MEKFLLPNEQSKTRLAYLRDSADAIEERTYYKRLTATELEQKRIDLTTTVLKLDDLEQEKKDFCDQIKEQVNPLKVVRKNLSGEVRTGFASHQGKLFKFIDRETKMVGYYSEEGELIETETRPATHEELAQLSIEFKNVVNQ